jgi:hypothetical protein
VSGLNDYSAPGFECLGIPGKVLAAGFLTPGNFASGVFMADDMAMRVTSAIYAVLFPMSLEPVWLDFFHAFVFRLLSFSPKLGAEFDRLATLFHLRVVSRFGDSSPSSQTPLRRSYARASPCWAYAPISCGAAGMKPNM